MNVETLDADRNRRRTAASELRRQRRPVRCFSVVRSLVASSAGRVGLTLFAVISALLIAGPSIWGKPANEADFTAKFLRPSWGHPFGTDAAGRDQFARVLAGGRTSIGAALIVLLGELCIGVLIGTAAGLAPVAVERAVMRVVDVVLAVPSQILALAIVGALGPGLRNLVVALVVAGWASYARVARGIVRSARNRTDVLAARLLGVRPVRLAAGHIVPGVLTQVAVIATLGVGNVIVAIAGLSFLGLGIQPPAAEWGAMLNESRFDLVTAPWLLLGPGLAILLCVVTATLLGDTARDLVERTGRDAR